MKFLPALLAGLLALAGPAFAHHSYALFDRDKEVALSGTIREFSWTNPHASIQISVRGADGGEQVWGVEGGSPNNLTRAGWKRTSLNPGDKVTIKVHPLRAGQHGGSLISVTLPDGKVLGETQQAAAASQPADR